MDMDVAAVFMASSILIGFGCIAIGITVIAINNLFARFWKPVQWSIIPEALRMPATRFAEPHELQDAKEPK
jgi:hypothetical protein